MTDTTPKVDVNYNQLAQLAHFAYGVLIPLIFALFHLWWLGAIGTGGWVAYKELYHDPFVNHDPWDGNLLDIAVWSAGIGVSFFLTWLAIHHGALRG